MPVRKVIFKEEKGVVIIIALLMLLVLTLIGISSISTTTFQVSISGNERVRTDAFYTAEAGIQMGINQLPITVPVQKTKLKKDSYYWSGTANDKETPKSLDSLGLYRVTGFDSSWEFKRFQVYMTGESFESINEIEVQMSYGPFRAGTGYN
jgi:hypothetical protein